MKIRIKKDNHIGLGNIKRQMMLQVISLVDNNNKLIKNSVLGVNLK